MSDETVAVTKHKGKAKRIKKQTTKACVNDALHEDVDGFPRPAEPRFQHREAYLHAKNEKRRDQCPRSVYRIDDVVALQRGIGRKYSEAQQVWVEEINAREKQCETSQLAAQEEQAVMPPFGTT